ncbi:adenylyl-sulfate kinase [Silanimonas lenta]|uniref:adenylyl-sulfate kinase n=1 Tax=Silanimonas lenta TaxID=265429 RepID=UPI0004016896|nr:adenylyl-sulfate kinase [Silanimonas lenta]
MDGTPAYRLPDDEGASRHGAHRALRHHEALPLLRFITCGSVDDGKSTLIGRLLHDSGSLALDQREALARDSARLGTQGGALDFALLVDGLEAEREQGITIDVAYRYFGTARRRFIVADCPGHEQYTRNMATGASGADLAVVLVDARKGVLPQTRRHSRIVRLLGLKRVVLAVNKMDLVGWSEARFRAIHDDYRALAQALGIEEVHAIPLSALHGDNLLVASEHSPWFTGQPLLPTLEALPALEPPAAAAFRLPVQWINRPHQDFRGVAGTVAAGRVAVGDTVQVLPAGTRATVARVIGPGRELAAAEAGQPVTLVFHEDLDVSRGDLVVAPGSAPVLARRLRADLVWLDEAPLVPGRRYLLRVGPKTVPAQVVAIEHQCDIHTGATHAAGALPLNAIGRVELELEERLPLARFEDERALGAFILIDRASHATAGAGTVVEAIAEGSGRAYAQAFSLGPAERAAAKGQQARCLWLTGLSGAGKSTLADALERHLAARGRHTMLLDGDNTRTGLSKDLGFAPGDRREHVRRLGEVARLMVEAGLIVIVSAISPYRADREAVRARFAPGEFIEVFVDASPETCAARDPKGLYARARAGELGHAIGIGTGYEPPLAPEVHVSTDATSVEASVAAVLAALGED